MVVDSTASLMGMGGGDTGPLIWRSQGTIPVRVDVCLPARKVALPSTRPTANALPRTPRVRRKTAREMAIRAAEFMLTDALLHLPQLASVPLMERLALLSAAQRVGLAILAS